MLDLEKLPMRFGGGKVAQSSLEGNMNVIDEMDDALLLAGIHIGFGDRRRKLAIALLEDGSHPQDVERLASNVAATTDTPAAAARVLYSILGSEQQRKARLGDIARQRQLEAARKVEPGASLRVRPEPVDRTDRVRLRMVAYARVVADRHPAEQVAADLGVTEEELDLLVVEEQERRRRTAGKGAMA